MHAAIRGEITWYYITLGVLFLQVKAVFARGPGGLGLSIELPWFSQWEASRAKGAIYSFPLSPPSSFSEGTFRTFCGTSTEGERKEGREVFML